MKRFAIANVVMVLMLGTAAAQAKIDACHVYVLDVAKARKAAESLSETGNAAADAKALSAVQTLFPEFYPVIGEEELTTKNYPFPGTRLTITASVYYTDESMASAGGSDSMTIGIAVGPKALNNALTADNNAASEIMSNDTMDTIRAKKYLRLNRRLYLIGIECRRKQSTSSK